MKDQNTEGFSRAINIHNFSFPKDHGPHPDYRTEWWYYTGNVKTGEEQHFGFQLTFFRTALTSEPLTRESNWGTKNIYMAHFAVTDVKGNRFYAFDRFSRDGLDLAGAKASPFHVWLEDWEVRGEGQNSLPMHLLAGQDEISIDLTLSSNKPVVVQGNKGLSQKGPTTGNASYYYSFTRMDTEGLIRIGEKIFNVKGLSWMDREWSTSALEKNQIGWDWFSLQLSDNREVMYYQMRRNDGSIDSMSNGTIIYTDGKSKFLSDKDVKLRVLQHWRTSDGKVIYPSHWFLEIPSEKLKLEVLPHINNQELNITVRYWEGAVKVKGTGNGKALTGNGYVELTGYSDMPK
ncbi:MAG TPA: lipocalin-like domain-containing protein [Candidatus Eremiobacteraeota bacterium]|nr:MAG: Hydroxyneurosporene synthase (CrtC) [bacterium ADurb.Bin363]HPZ08466.1 lipocalin-like domain-containing protein [Candidatus Eremiobacteraeota bacterium]